MEMRLHLQSVTKFIRYDLDSLSIPLVGGTFFFENCLNS